MMNEEMTNEEARRILLDIADQMPSDKCADWINAISLGIKAIDAQPKIGHWICHRDHCENLGVIPSGLGVYEWCSNCDCGIDIMEFHRNYYNYCPNCGADMTESEDEVRNDRKKNIKI